MLITSRPAKSAAFDVVLGALVLTFPACNDTAFEPLVEQFVEPSRPAPPPVRPQAFPSVSGTVFNRVTYSFIAGPLAGSRHDPWRHADR